MTTNESNPRAVLGDNQAPDYAKEITERMGREYAELVRGVDELLAEEEAAPAKINSDAEMTPVLGIIKRMRDADTRAEALRVAEKLPHQRRGEGIDSFFFALRERIARRNKTGKLGMMDRLQLRVHDWQQRKLAEEERRRALALAEARRVEEEALRKQQAEEQAKRDAEAAAARARKPENVAAHEEKAQDHGVAAEVARVDTIIAGDNLRQAEVSAAAKPADMVRTRTDEGMATMGREAYAEVVDYAKLDINVLRPFIKQEAIAMALRSWARTTSHSVPMDGASIGFRPKTVIR